MNESQYGPSYCCVLEAGDIPCAKALLYCITEQYCILFIMKCHRYMFRSCAVLLCAVE